MIPLTVFFMGSSWSTASLVILFLNDVFRILQRNYILLLLTMCGIPVLRIQVLETDNNIDRK